MIYDQQMNELKRRLNQQTPYPRVMLDHKVRRLELQVREDLTRSLSGRAKRPEDPFTAAQRGGGNIDRDYFDQVRP